MRSVNLVLVSVGPRAVLVVYCSGIAVNRDRPSFPADTFMRLTGDTRSCSNPQLVNHTRTVVNHTRTVVNHTRTVVNHTRAVVNHTRTQVNHTCIRRLHCQLCMCYKRCSQPHSDL